MSDDAQWNEIDSEAEEKDEQKPGMSTGKKILLVLLGLGGLTLLLCCGGVLYVANQFKSALVEDPEKIVDIKEEIAAIELPEEFLPKGGMDFAGMGFIPEVKMVVYEYKDEKTGGLMLLQMKFPESIQTNQQQMKAQMQQQQQQQGGDQELTNITDRETRTYTIHGEEVEVQFRTGDDKDGVTYREAQAYFSGESEQALRFLVIRIQADEYDQEMVDGIINSIE